MKVTLEMNETQAKVLMNALELYSRLKMGQLDTLKWMVVPIIPETSSIVEFNNTINELKKIMFPDLEPNQYYGIFMEEAGDGQIAFDIYQVVRHDISWFKEPKGGVYVDFNTPMRASKEPLPKVNVENG